MFSSYRFRCPYTGIYFVSVTYWKHPEILESYRVNAILYRGDRQVINFSHDLYNLFNYVTNNALIRCNAGEYIESRAHVTSYIYGSGSYPESIITVMSLHKKGNYTMQLLYLYISLPFVCILPLYIPEIHNVYIFINMIGINLQEF